MATEWGLLFGLCGALLALGLYWQARASLKGKNVLPAYLLKFGSLIAFFYLLSKREVSVVWGISIFLFVVIAGIALALVAQRKKIR